MCSFQDKTASLFILLFGSCTAFVERRSVYPFMAQFAFDWFILNSNSSFVCELKLIQLKVKPCENPKPKHRSQTYFFVQFKLLAGLMAGGYGWGCGGEGGDSTQTSAGQAAQILHLNLCRSPALCHLPLHGAPGVSGFPLRGIPCVNDAPCW